MPLPAPNPSLQSRVIAAAVAALNAEGANLSPAVQAYRTRMEPFTVAQLPAWNVLPDDSEADYSDAYSGSVDWKFRWKMRCTAAAVNEVDAAADPLYVAGSQAILNDPTLGGVCLRTRFSGIKWEREGQGEYDQCALVVTFESEFATSQSDPSVLQP